MNFGLFKLKLINFSKKCGCSYVSLLFFPSLLVFSFMVIGPVIFLRNLPLLRSLLSGNHADCSLLSIFCGFSRWCSFMSYVAICLSVCHTLSLSPFLFLCLCLSVSLSLCLIFRHNCCFIDPSLFFILVTVMFKS